MGDPQEIKYTKDPSYTFAMNILHRIDCMMEAKSAQDWDRYYYEFDNCTKIISPYLTVKKKKMLQGNYNLMQQAIVVIKKEEKNEQTRNSKIRELRTAFAMSMEILIVNQLSSLDIIKATEEGVIDFEVLNINEIQSIIHKASSIPELDRRRTRVKEESDAENETEMEEPKTIIGSVDIDEGVE